MQKARYINPRGESIYFDIKPPFILQRIEGTGNVEANISSQKSPYQDGETYLNSKLELRELFMQVTLMNSDTEQLFKMRQDLQRVFNPKVGVGKLIYETPNGVKMIDCIPDGTPIFGEYKSSTITCQINLIAHNPLWTDLDDLQSSTTNVSNYITKYDILPNKPYFEADIQKSGTTIINNGTFNTSLVIEVSGASTENLVITNDTNSGSLEIVRMIPFGSKLYINTSFGKLRTVKLISNDGVESNGFPYLSFHSKFIQLEVGENTLIYESNEDISISATWHNCYIGL